MMWSNLFNKGKEVKKISLEQVLDRLVDYNPKTANCVLIKTSEGLEVNEDFGRAFLFRFGDKLYIDDQAIYITTPDGIKAESGYHLDRGHILHLSFLHNRVPHTMDCRVIDRIRFPNDVLANLDPRMPGAFKLKPVGDVLKKDKRSSLRFTHKVGRGAMKVYTQILFDLFVSKTNFTYPTQGGLPPRITDLQVTGYVSANDLPTDPEAVVKFLKNSLRSNPREDRVVYVSKPHMDERTNRVSLAALGHSSVLGLENPREGERTLFVKKPTKMSSDRKSPNNLRESDQVLLGYQAKSLLDFKMEYYELVAEVVRVGTENVTVRPRDTFRRESGLGVELVDFSVGGIKVEADKALLDYLLGDLRRQPIEAQQAVLQDMAILLNFYPKLRFNRETEIYRPDVPLKIQILGKVARSEVSPVRADEAPEVQALGLKFMYDPTEYSRDAHTFDRWERIREFKENRHFREIHTSLNGLIAFLESQSR